MTPTKSSRRTLEEALRLSLQRQGAIARFGTRALAAVDLLALLQYAVEEVAMAVDAEYVKIMEYRPATSDLLVRAGVGWKDGDCRSRNAAGPHEVAARPSPSDQRTNPHHRYPTD